MVGFRVLSFVAIVWLLVYPLTVAAQDSIAAADQDAASETPSSAVVAVEDVVDDAAIEARLQEILTSTDWFADVNVTARSGIITLSGVADNSEHREWASNVAGNTEDVVAVINKLVVDDKIDFSSSAEVIGESLDALRRDFLIRLPLLIAAAIVLVFTVLTVKLVGWALYRILDRRRLRTSLKDLLLQLTSIGLWVLGLLIATVVAFPGMTPSKAITVLGLGSVAIGFAFKDIFENFFAGILILWGYPFDRGDFIETGEIIGKVEQITIRNTLIRRLDGELAVVPNAQLFKNTVDVLTSQPQRRVRIICGVAYGEKVDEAREVIREAVVACESITGVRTVEVFAKEFGDSSINFEVAWWTGAKPIDIRHSRDEVVGAIKAALDSAGIEIPFPYRTLTFKDPAVQEAFKRTSLENRTFEPGE